jgi:tetratricopeptide (TPR) repeat protein
MTPKAWLSASALSLAFTSLACAPPRSKVEEGVAIMRAETAPRELAGRGDAFAAAGDMTRAEQYFVAALREGGEPARLVRRLISVCVADGRYPVALEYADDYLRRHPGDVDVRYAAATLRVAVGDARRARRELDLVLAAQPALGEAHYVLALLEKGEGDAMAADREFRAYLAQAPEGERADIARANLMGSVP